VVNWMVANVFSLITFLVSLIALGIAWRAHSLGKEGSKRGAERHKWDKEEKFIEEIRSGLNGTRVLMEVLAELHEKEELPKERVIRLLIDCYSKYYEKGPENMKKSVGEKIKSLGWHESLYDKALKLR